jgi:hypothetical protein
MAIQITKAMQERVEGKRVAFMYKGKRVVKEVKEIMDVILGTWVADLGFEDDNDDSTDSFIMHGNTDESHLPQMQGLVVQYDSEDGSRHGYVREVEVL